MEIKCTTAPRTAAEIKSSRTIQLITNAVIDGTVIIIAIIVPLSTISEIENLDFLSSVNR